MTRIILKIYNYLLGVYLIYDAYDKHGTFLKVTGIIGIALIVINIILQFTKSRKEKMMDFKDTIKFGYIWLISVLFIPVLFILIGMGF